MAPAARRQLSATPAKLAFPAGAGHSAAASSKCVAASLSSAAERGPAPQATVSPAILHTETAFVTVPLLLRTMPHLVSTTDESTLTVRALLYAIVKHKLR